MERFRHPGAIGSVDSTEVATPLHTVHLDMMQRGTYYDRPSGQVRQCSVTVDGATRLVTSGDTVPQDVFDALVEAGIVAAEEGKGKSGAKPSTD